MPYRRGYRKTYRKRTTRRKTAVRSIARREAIKVVNRSEETKVLDGSWFQGATSYTGSLINIHGTYAPSTFSFTPIVQGSDTGQYSGRALTPKYLVIRYQFAVADTTNLCTLMLMQAKGNWANQGNMVNILQLTNSLMAPLSPLNTSYNDRLRILYRRQHQLDATTPIRNGIIKVSWKKLRKIMFSDNAGTIETGQIMLGAISDSSAISHPMLTAVWRFYYKDS